MQVGILGPLQVTSAQGEPVGVGGARLRALLIRLALDAGARVSGEALAEALWGDAPPGDQANALQSLVSRLRRALPESGLVVSEPGGYRLAAEPECVDAARFERLAGAGRRALGRGEPGPAAGTLREALALWRGPALADAGDAPYVAAAAARLAELRDTAVEDLAEAELAAGRPAAVLADLEALVGAHPLRERPRALLIRARYAAGRQAEALAGYAEYRSLLAEELGTEPGPELRELHLAVLRADPALAPAPRPPAGNLRAPLTSFVGREEELRLVGERLAEARLVTLVGPGGAGKTRLATTAAAELAGGFPGGVWLVELASVGDPEDVPRAALDALGAHARGVLEPRPPSAASRDALDQLVDALSGAPALLVLDNCEHLVDAAAGIADRLLGDCPGLRVLATSREPLGILGEALSPVPPLRLPPPGAPAAEAAASPAVRLLAERAAAVRPGFTVHDGNVTAVREICRRLDGLPLAIELAAARLRTLDPDHLASRLDDRFRLLTGGSRTALPRHQTLRAVVAWSWELLSDEERRLAEWLAVFAGGVTPESAEGVCGLPAGEALEPLTSLADKSLLQLAEGDGGSGPRFRMLETLREYGGERLAAAGLARAARDAHAAYFLRLAETAAPHLRGPAQLTWLATLTAERDNLLAALHHAVAVADADTAVRLVAALGLYWTMRGHHDEATHWLRLALDVPGASPWEARTVASGLFVLNATATGRPAEAWPEAERLRAELARPGVDARTLPLVGALEQGLAMFADPPAEGARLPAAVDHPDPWTRAMLRLMRAAILENAGDPDGVLAELRPAVAGFREAGDRWGLGMALTSLGELCRQRGELAEARATLTEALGLMGELRSESGLDQLRALLAVVRVEQGELDAVREELIPLAEAADRHGSGYRVAHVRLALGDLARRRGDPAEAREHYETAMRHVERRTFVQPQLSALVRAGLALVALSEGDTRAAGTLLGQALDEAIDVWDMPVVARVGVAVALLCEGRGEPALAAEALGAAQALRGMPDLGSRDTAALTARLEAALGAGPGAAALRRGAGRHRDAAVDLLRGAALVGADGEREEHREQAGRPQQGAGDGPRHRP